MVYKIVNWQRFLVSLIVKEYFERFRISAILKIHLDNNSELNAHAFLTFSHISINFFQTQTFNAPGFNILIIVLIIKKN